MITSNRQSAAITLMPTLAQCLWIWRSTDAALRCAARIDFHQQTTSLFSFVRELPDERRPSGVVNMLSEHTSRQALDIQLFNNDQPKQNNELPGFFVRKILSLIAHMGMRSLQFQNRFLSVIASAFATGNLALRPSQFCLRILEVSRILNLRPVSESRECSQTDVDPCRFIRGRQRFRFALDAEHNVPLASFSLDRDGFDLAFK